MADPREANQDDQHYNGKVNCTRDHSAPLPRGQGAHWRWRLVAPNGRIIADSGEAHAMKHRGITDTAGTRKDKQLAGGHKSEAMTQLYDHEVPVVPTPKKGDFSGEFREALAAPL